MKKRNLILFATAALLVLTAGCNSEKQKETWIVQDTFFSFHDGE